MIAPTTELPSADPGPAAGRYPADLERTWYPAGREQVRIRALRPEDIELELHFVEGLSRQTLYRRMQYYAAQVSRHEIERLLDVDYVDRLAVGGFVRAGDAERIVGVSRFARIEGTTRAECAIVVADDWQGCGLGTELMRSLIQAALARGYTCLEGETLAENVGVSAWARRFGFNVQTEPGSGGLAKVTLQLDQLLPPS